MYQIEVEDEDEPESDGVHGSAVRLLRGSSACRGHREVVRSDECVFGNGWIFAERDDFVVCEQSNGFDVTISRYQIYHTRY